MLLGAQYKIYRHAHTNESLVRTTSYALPSALHDHVNVVAPTTFFGVPQAYRKTVSIRLGAPVLANGDAALRAEIAKLSPLATVPSSCGSTITPACLRALYNTTSYTPKATATNKLGVAGYLDEYAVHSDLKTFLNRFRSDAASADFTVVQVNGGGNDQSDPGTEVCSPRYVGRASSVTLFAGEP